MTQISIAIVLIGGGFALVLFAKRLDLGFGDVSKAALVLAPLLLYLFMTGRISEFEGLGWKAKFRALASESVISAAKAADLVLSEEDANRPNYFNEAFLMRCRGYYILRDKDAYTENGEIDENAVIQIATAIRTSIVCGQFRALVVVDSDFKPVGLFPWQHFIEIIRINLESVSKLTAAGSKAPRMVAPQ
ncbi:hypothetical protein VSX64_03975 [Aurantimonas sp. C2-6-R+9]|uniref:hypothetical protein n=1 Tax=unclassified Aurantimonas TaxID=2638230 RepID=UPI002E18F220|nr:MULTISPECIES: hypothetical protein [unclassified Aurantimonas]MEC5289816.1 hypothetical protein [Aurantimonas sp. C2-3-R2]MEC5380043.1 hypothetical protein [Aurantimonas sp. C2-6-R+9]MEC5410898.1 hypothetical protein [Aurantimonas sp. C2-4-R8]